MGQPTDQELRTRLFGEANEYLASRPGLLKRAAKLGAVQTADWAVDAAIYEVNSAAKRAKNLLGRPLGSLFPHPR